MRQFKQIKKHRFDITVGLELSSSEKDNMRINSDYYPIDYTANDILSMWNNGKAEPTTLLLMNLIVVSLISDVWDII